MTLGRAQSSAALRAVDWAAELSVRMRATMLSQLGLMPTLYGNQRKVFSRSATARHRVAALHTANVGFKVICNPSVADMKHYLRGGNARGPLARGITRMVRLESALRSRLLGDVAGGAS